ncbi:MAG: hypothetical protein R3D55_07600, partial [Chloroflexota bacterium]
YQEIADRCYFNFLRVYTPANATLSEATAHQVPGAALMSQTTWQGRATATSEFASYTTFTNFFMLPRGEQLTTAYQYSLPPTVLQPGNEGEFVYTLWLRKQAGQSPEPVQINVTLPEGSAVLHAGSSNNATIKTVNNAVEISLELQTDTQITVHFSQP